MRFARAVFVFFLAAALATAQKLMSPAEVARPIGGPPAVFTADKYFIRDNQGGILTWDLQGEIGNPAATTVAVYLRDNAGVKVIEFQRTLIGTPTNIARLDMSLEPLTSSSRKLGSSTRLWLEAYALSVFTQGLHSTGGSSQINLHDHLIPAAAATQDIADSTHRVRKIWTVDLDCSGVCGTTSFWSRVGTTVKPATIADDVLMRKLQLEDNSGSATGLFWDLQALVPNPASGTVKALLRDNAGATVQEWERKFLGSTSNISRIDMSLEPMTSSSRSLGSSTRLFLETYSLSVYTQGLHATGGASHINLADHLKPTGSGLQDVGDSSHRVRTYYGVDGDFSNTVTAANLVGDVYSNAYRAPFSGSTMTAWAHWVPGLFNTHDLGTALLPWRKLYAVDIQLLGTCTGCGGYFTDGGSTTYLNNGDNILLGAGAGSTAYKLDVAGAQRVQSNLDVDGSVTVSSAAVQRMQISASSTTFSNGAATIQASVNHNNGSIWGSNGFYTGPFVTQVINSSAQWVGIFSLLWTTRTTSGARRIIGRPTSTRRARSGSTMAPSRRHSGCR